MGINNCTCWNCGGKNEDSDTFCRYCGKPLPSKGEIQKRQEKQKKQLSIASIFLAIIFVVSIVLFVIDYTNNRKAKESSIAESNLLNDDSYETYSLGDIKFRIPDTYKEVDVSEVGDDTLGFSDEGASNIFIVIMMVNSNEKLIDEFVDKTHVESEYNPETKFYTFTREDGEITYGYLSEDNNFYMFAITGDDALSILDTVKQK